MAKINVLRALSRLKQPLDRAGITALPPVRGAAAYVKRKWFGEFYGKETISAHVDGLLLTFPKQFAAHFVFSDYEPLTRKTFVDSIKPGMTVVDVGAHIGYFSLLAARLVGRDGTLYAIEPSLQNLEFLKVNIHNNGFDNIHVHSVAAGRDHRSRIFQITGSSDSHGFYPHPNTATLHTVDIEQYPLDEIIGGRVDAIKIDVEGAEIEVLEGMSEMLLRNKHLVLWAEWFPAGMRSAGRDPFELPDALERLGFSRISVIDEKAKLVRTVAETNALLRSGALPKDWYGNIWARHSVK